MREPPNEKMFVASYDDEKPTGLVDGKKRKSETGWDPQKKSKQDLNKIINRLAKKATNEANEAVKMMKNTRESANQYNY